MNWQSELKKNYTHPSELCSRAEGLEDVVKQYPMSVTRYYASLINREDPMDPIAKMCIPSEEELSCGGDADTSGELSNTKATGIQHKYGPTALILSTNICATYCRHCFRKRLAGVSDEEILKTLNEAVEYISARSEITNVLISGGDALLNSNTVTEQYLKRLSEIERLEMIRLGSRVPVVFPERIYGDEELLGILKKYSLKKKLYVSTQFNHPRELTPEAERAVHALSQAGVILHNQTVLLKGVNDSPATLGMLMRSLTSFGITPYYLFQCRPTAGVKSLFQVPISRAYDIVEEAKSTLSGYSKRFRYVMSHPTGKIEIIGRTGDGRMVFKYHQAKSIEDSGRMFAKKLPPDACWLENAV